MNRPPQLPSPIMDARFVDGDLVCRWNAHPPIERRYFGSESSAFADYEAEADRLATHGYRPIHTSWKTRSLLAPPLFFLALFLGVVAILALALVVWTFRRYVPAKGSLSVRFDHDNATASCRGRP
ncbi:MAG: hypothetical protein KDC95_23105 [Planctomycetes bacterium]|nr:hypothetical protein [Planctomycetota bacterium]